MAQLAVVTGGAGFIGTHLVRRLMEAGYTVISLDNYFTGSMENHIPGATYRTGHTKDIRELIPEKPDIVFHLGEYSRVAKSMEEPETVWDLNLAGTLGVLEFCRERGAKLVYAGSSTKFAETRADGTPGRDLSPYTLSKAMNTELVASYGRWYGLPFVITYFYNVYGPGELAGSYGTVIEIFHQNLREGKPHKVNGPGTQRRVYTHVLDTVEGLLLAGEKGEGDEYGIGSDDDYSILEVAELFGGPIEMMPARATSRPSSVVDASKLKTLGWKPTHTLADYIQTLKESV